MSRCIAAPRDGTVAPALGGERPGAQLHGDPRFLAGVRGRCRGRWIAVALVAALGLAGCGPKSEQELIASAKAYIDKNEHAAAAVQLKAALQQRPGSPQVRYLLGVALLKTGNAPAAVVELEKARELKHNPVEVVPVLARALLNAGRAKKVTDSLAETTLDDPRAMAELSAVVAAAYAEQGHAERSQAAITKALQADARNSDARLLQARLMAGRGQLNEALTVFDALLADEPRNRDAWYFNGETLLKATRHQEAAQAFKKAVELDPKYLLAHNALLGALLQQRDIPEFRARVQQMKAVFPNQPDTRYFDAQLALFDKDFDKARGLMRQLLREVPENARLLQLAGAIELTGGSPVVAEAHLTKAVQLQPKLMPARRLLARTYLRNNRPARVLTTLQPLFDQNRDGDAEALSLAGEAYLQNGQLKEAEAYFQKAAKVSPDDVRIRTGMAFTQIAKGNAEAGLSDLEKLAATNSATYLDLALITARLRRGEFDKAMKDVDRLQKKLPDSALPHQLRGRVQLGQKDVAGARASFDKAVIADPSYLPAVASLATLDVLDKRIEVAIKRLETFLAREPKSFQALLALAELKQQAGATPTEIRNLLTEAIRISPDEVAPRILLVDYLIGLKDLRAARTVAQEALGALPDDPGALDALGRTQLANGDVQQALSAFNKVVTLQPNSAPAHLWLAQAQSANKDDASARRSLNRALEIDPASLPAQRALIQIAMSQKRLDEALSLARTIQKQRPAEAAGYQLEADVLGQQRSWEPALAALRNAMQRQKSTAVATRMHATLLSAGKSTEADQFAAGWLRDRPKDVAFLSYLGAIDLDRRQFDQAESRFRSVLALDPKNVNALNNVAWALVQQGKKGALPFAQKATQLAPDQPALMDTLADALAAEGQLAPAIEVQRRALQQAGGRPEYRLHLAKLLIANGDRVAARGELVTLARLGDSFAGRAEAVKLLQSL